MAVQQPFDVGNAILELLGVKEGDVLSMTFHQNWSKGGVPILRLNMLAGVKDGMIVTEVKRFRVEPIEDHPLLKPAPPPTVLCPESQSFTSLENR